MKKLLALLSLLLCCHLVNAQKLVVRDFKPEPGDQTAMNPETQEIDQNGNRAALIRIYTPLKRADLAFEGSVSGFTRVKESPGQILLYLPSRSQKVTITHSRYQPVTYWYEDEIEPGRTYSMYLTVEGKEVSFAASTDGADITVDGDTVGVSPTRVYVPYGPHVVKAQLGTLIFEDMLEITPEGDESFRLPMEDENLKYGDITVNVPGNAEIYFQGRREGVGSATFHLKEGVYPVETRRKDHDNRITNVTVSAGEATNVDLTPPFPHTGYLEIETEPVNGVSILAADTVFSDTKTMHLNVGQYELRFDRKGYFPVDRVYDITKGITTYDTIRLVRKQYVKPTGVYAGAGFTFSKMPGVTIKAGGLYKNIDASVSYAFGVTKSDPVDWYDDRTEFFVERARYRMDELEVKAGWQFAFVERFGVTPQTGFMAQMLHGDGTKGNNFSCYSIPIGVTLSYVPIPKVAVWLNPEYAIPVSAGGQYKSVAKFGGFSKGGFHISVGASYYIM